MKLLQKENLETLFNDYCESGSVYKSLAGISGKALTADEKYDEHILVNLLMKRYMNGFSYLGTPESTLNDPNQEFCHVISKDFNTANTKHRLYFHFADHHKSLRFVLDYIDSTKLNNIPSYIKFDKIQDRNDGFVIYVEDQHIEQVVQILDQLAQQDPNITKSKELPMASYDCGWYGYAKELKETKHSFNKNIESSFLTALAQMMQENNLDVTEERLNQDGSTSLIYSPSKILNNARQIQSRLNPQNSEWFYQTLSDGLLDLLTQRGLLLNENTVPKCISRQNERTL